jgi:hypothetical protein
MEETREEESADPNGGHDSGEADQEKNEKLAEHAAGFGLRGCNAGAAGLLL